MRRFFVAALFSLLSCVALAAASAQAAVVTVGSPLTQTFTTETINVLGTFANTKLSEPGAHVTSPVSGAILRWHILGAEGGPFKLRVLRPNGLNEFTGVGTSSPQTPGGVGLQTFTTAMPIQAGDLIALDNGQSFGDSVGLFSSPAVQFSDWIPPLAEGSTRPAQPDQSKEFAFNAEVQPAPAVTGLSPAGGLPAGGTQVTISGTDFEGASAVRFGSVPALAYTVNSESQITAFAPPGTGAVPVTVTTIAGTAISPQAFTYATTPVSPVISSCKVPKLKGKTLKSAKKRIRAAGCRIGTVTKKAGATAKDGVVVKQVPKPGATVVANAKVKITLAPKSGG